MKAGVALMKFEHGRVERGGGEKRRVNPPIGAIEDRLIGGFGGKSKSQTSITCRGYGVSLTTQRLFTTESDHAQEAVIVGSRSIEHPQKKWITHDLYLVR